MYLTCLPSVSAKGAVFTPDSALNGRYVEEYTVNPIPPR